MDNMFSRASVTASPEASQNNTVPHYHLCIQILLCFADRSIQHWCRYYTGWKAYSNFKALAGANALNSCFRVLDSIKLEKLKQELSQLQDSGVVFPKDSWPANLLAKSPRCVVRYLACIAACQSIAQYLDSRIEPASHHSQEIIKVPANLVDEVSSIAHHV